MGRQAPTVAASSVSSPITRRVYNLGLDEFISWYGQEQRAGFTKATVNAWRVTLAAAVRAFLCGIGTCKRRRAWLTRVNERQGRTTGCFRLDS